MKNTTAALLLLLIFACSAPSESPEEKALADRISRIENGLYANVQYFGDSIPKFNIEERLRELGIPGVSIAFINNGEIEWARAYGMADSSENRPMTPETMLLAGSISKPVAAIRAHQLAEQGLISLDSNVNNYLSSWKVPDNEFTEEEKVTIRRILNHTAGLTVWGFPGYDKGDTVPTVPQVLDGEGNTDAVRVYKEPGESWQYSGGGYTIMQLAITDLEGKTFPEIMQTEVLDPLGMTGSTFENPLPEKYHSIAATGYRTNGDEVEGKWPIYPEMAAAGLWTTPSELILYAKEFQRISNTQEDGILKASTTAEMLTPGLNDHGLGPVIEEFTFGHGGADEGFRAELIAWKDEPFALVIMINSDNSSIAREIKLSIADEYGLPGIEPIHREVMEMSTEELEKFTGKYTIPDLGELQVNIKENGLVQSAPFISVPMFLLPASDSSFFVTSDGEYVEFLMDGESVTGFRIYGVEATKKD